MKDLFLTPRGDLAIKNTSTDNKRLEINFITSKSNALRLNFYIEDTFKLKSSVSSLEISFMTEKPEYNKEIELVSGDSYIEQAIRIRLLTSLGSLRENADIGSRLESVVHQYVDEVSTINNLEKYIKESIADLIPNPLVYISKPNSRYMDYSTTLKVVIADGDKRYNITI